MAESILNKKLIASSKCKLMRGEHDRDPFFCKIVLTEDALVFLNDELLKQGELLFNIPISQIKDFIFISEREQKNKLFLFFDTIFGVLTYVIDGLGIFNKNENEDKNKADILSLSFVNEQGENVNFILDMMEYGENNLIKAYKKLN